MPLPTKQIAEAFFGYTPNHALAIAGAIAYGTIGSALSFRVVSSKAWWALCLPIGSFAEALGFTLRVVCKYEPDSTILFTIQQLFIVCSPAAFLAFNYVLYGRLISYVGAEHSIVKSQKIATIFVISDVSTFMMQACGSGLIATGVAITIGERVALAGIILQFASYCIFCVLLVKSHISIRSGDAFSTYESCRMVIRALYLSSAFIFTRFIYRIVEFSQGRHGYLLVHEAFLYAMDVSPMLLAIAVYVPWWPTKYIKLDKSKDLEMDQTPSP